MFQMRMSGAFGRRYLAVSRWGPVDQRGMVWTSNGQTQAQKIKMKEMRFGTSPTIMELRYLVRRVRNHGISRTGLDRASDLVDLGFRPKCSIINKQARYAMRTVYCIGYLDV